MVYFNLSTYKVEEKKMSWGKACMPESLSAFSSYMDLEDVIPLTSLALLCNLRLDNYFQLLLG